MKSKFILENLFIDHEMIDLTDKIFNNDSQPNSSLNNNGQGDHLCMDIYRIYHFYIEKIMGAIGSLLNILCIIVFLKLIRKKASRGDMYKYLLFKSAIDTCVLLRNFLYIFIECKVCGFNKFYAFKLIELILFVYFSFVTQLISMLCELAANFDRYKILSKKCKAFNGITYKYGISGMLIYSSLFYLYKFFERTIVKRHSKINNSTTEYYSLIYTKFGISDQVIVFDFIHSLIRDGLIVMMMFTLNMMTLCAIKKILAKKKNLTKSFNEKNHRSEIKTSIMLLVTSVIAIVGHSLYFVFNIPWFVFHVSECMYPFINFVYYLSFTVNFFVYFFFNKHFRNSLPKLFNKN